MADQTQAAPAAQPGVRNDPFAAHYFKLELGTATGTAGGGETLFHECSNIGVKVQALTWRTPKEVFRIPGMVEYADIRLKYGLTKSRDMWDWLMTAVSGDVKRRDCSIILLANDGKTEAMRWNLTSAWIAEWRGSGLNAMTNSVAIEEIVLVYESLKRD